MKYPTYLSIPFKQSDELPSEYDFEDVRFSPNLVTYLIETYSSIGDVILDPFVGYGTTIIVAERMNRKGFGIEIDGRKVNYLRKYLGFEKQLIHGDTRRLFLNRILPPIDLIITSPPYMSKDETADALTGYRYSSNYQNYLENLANIFASFKSILQPSATIIVEISNLKSLTGITTLAWDVGKKLASIFDFEGEIIITWTGERRENGIYNYGYDHSYCLVYSNS